MCLSKDDSNTVEEMLRSKKEIHDRIHLEFKCIDNLQEESFDVVILSLLVDNETELKCVKENNLNVALTSARCVSTF
jgi:superfamily I DNA and/or RNA helicase